MPTLFTPSAEKLPPAVRGLSSDLAALADEAVSSGLRYDGPNTDEVVAAIAAIKRYLNRKKWTVRTVYDGETVAWQAVPMREREPMSDEHKAKLQASLKRSRAAKARAQAKANG